LSWLTPLGRVPELQVEPPSVEKSTCPRPLLVTPTATQSLVGAHDTEPRLITSLGRVPELQVEPPSVE
jgi:hypothetical protein